MSRPSAFAAATAARGRGPERGFGRARVSALAVLIAVAAAASSARAQDSSDDPAGPIVTVRGEGQSQAQPQFARFSATVETRATSLAEAAERQRSKVASATDLLNGLGAHGLSVERSDVSLERAEDGTARVAPDGETDSDESGRYLARTTFVLRVRALDALSDDLNAVLKSGLFGLAPVTFGVDDAEAPLNAARRIAIARARTAAEAYAESGGFRLGAIEKVLDVTPQSFSSLASAPASRSKADAEPLVPPRRLTYHASVVVTWRIEPK